MTRTSTFCWTTTLRSTFRSRPTQTGISRGPMAGATTLGGISRRPMAGATRLGWTSGPMAGATTLGGTSGPTTGTATFRMRTWTSGLTLGINAEISGGISRRPMAGATRLGGISRRLMAGATRLGWTSGPTAGTATFRMRTWTSGLTLGINAGISRGPMAGTTTFAGISGRPMAGATTF